MASGVVGAFCRCWGRRSGCNSFAYFDRQPGTGGEGRYVTDGERDGVVHRAWNQWRGTG